MRPGSEALNIAQKRRSKSLGPKARRLLGPAEKNLWSAQREISSTVALERFQSAQHRETSGAPMERFAPQSLWSDSSEVPNR